MTERERLLLDAAAAVRERGESYGDPQAHFARTVGAITARNSLSDKHFRLRADRF